MKKSVFLIGFCWVLLMQNAWAQRSSEKYNRYFSKDQLSFSFYGSQWIATETAPQPEFFSRGVAMQMMYPIIGNRSNVALALGFGFASQNYYINQLITTTPESIGFSPIPDSVSYRKYKLNTNYLTIPLELRIRTNPDPHYRRSFKIYPGFRLGGLVNGHTKYVGDDLNTGEQIKVKEYHIRHLEKLNYGLTLRIGYGKIMLHGYYSLTELFDKTYTGSIHPFEVGLSLVLF